MAILITGTSGYVGSSLVPLLAKSHTLIGLDKAPSEHTQIVIDLRDSDLSRVIAGYLEPRRLTIDIVINLAASRTDFKNDVNDYYEANVSATKNFLSVVDQLKTVKYFLSIASVAAIDGEAIAWSSSLDADDAYRCTKFIQNQLIRDYCADRGVKFCSLAPSAIFDNQMRLDTNIGKFQRILQVLPFFPSIQAKKSVTFLPKFTEEISRATEEQIIGAFLCIETPVLTVTEMASLLKRGAPLRIVEVPGFKSLLLFLSLIVQPVARIIRIDPVLTRNRVHKLFRNTCYESQTAYNTDFYAKAPSSVKVFQELADHQQLSATK